MSACVRPRLNVDDVIIAHLEPGIDALLGVLLLLIFFFFIIGLRCVPSSRPRHLRWMQTFLQLLLLLFVLQLEQLSLARKLLVAVFGPRQGATRAGVRQQAVGRVYDCCFRAAEHVISSVVVLFRGCGVEQDLALLFQLLLEEIRQLTLAEFTFLCLKLLLIRDRVAHLVLVRIEMLPGAIHLIDHRLQDGNLSLAVFFRGWASQPWELRLFAVDVGVGSDFSGE